MKGAQCPYSSANWDKAGYWTYLEIRGGLFLAVQVQSMSLSENCSQFKLFSTPQLKEGALWKDIAATSLYLQPLQVGERGAYVSAACNNWNTRCIYAGEDSSLLAPSCLQLASLIPGNLAKCCIDSTCRIPSCLQVIVKFTTFIIESSSQIITLSNCVSNEHAVYFVWAIQETSALNDMSHINDTLRSLQASCIVKTQIPPWL